MAETLKTRLNGVSIFVLFYGVFVAFSLIHQAVVPFFAKYVELTGYSGFFASFLNTKFVLPMGMITDLWALVSAAYIGVDRAAFSVAAFKDHEGGDKPLNYGEKKHIIQIIALNFAIYVIAVGLNTFLDADFALTPLVVAFGSSILLYVSGNKIIMASDKLAKKQEEQYDFDLNEEKLLRQFKELMDAERSFAVHVFDDKGKPELLFKKKY